MALSARSRSSLYQHLTRLIDDEKAVDELLSQYPSGALDQPATRDHLRAEAASLRVEMHVELSSLRAEMHTELSSLRSEMHAGFAALHKDLSAEMRRWFGATIVIMIALVGLARLAG